MRKLSNLEALAIAELDQRNRMAVSVFRPQPHQDEIFIGRPKELLILGGNRCVVAGSVVVKVVDGQRLDCKVEELVVGDLIISGEDAPVRVNAIRVFDDFAIRMETESGRFLEGTFDHPVMACLPQFGVSKPEESTTGWVHLSQLTVGYYVLTVDGWERVVSAGACEGQRRIVAISTDTETYLSNGILSHNSGKSTCASVLFAAFALDMQITLSDGVTKVDPRLPREKGECLTCWLVGFDQKHIGQSLHRMLFRADLFKVIYDKETKRLRAWQPWKEEDKNLRDQARPAPPLIPNRCIVPGSWSWENRSNREFIRVQVKNPFTGKPTADIFAYSSKAEPKAGDPVSCIYIDEAIAHEEHYPEWQARLLDKGGRMWWASWPSISNEALQQLSERCQNSAEKGDGLFKEVRLTMSGNATLNKADVDAFIASCATDEIRQARDLGLFVTEQLRSYPLFDANIHSAIVVGDRISDKLSQVLKDSAGTPPPEWTRHLILDPGTQRPGVLLIAVPPPEYGDYMVPYDEIYPGRADPWQLAKAVRSRVIGQEFHRFIVDYRAARQTTLGMKLEMTVYDAYAEAFEKEGLRCRMTGHRFEMGSDDVGGRIAIVRGWLHANDKGFPKLRIVTHRCIELCKQLKKVKKAIANKEEKDDRHAPGQTIDLVHCLEYSAAANLKYHYANKLTDEASFSEGYKWYLKRFGNKSENGQPNISIGTSYIPR